MTVRCGDPLTKHRLGRRRPVAIEPLKPFVYRELLSTMFLHRIYHLHLYLHHLTSVAPRLTTGRESPSHSTRRSMRGDTVEMAPNGHLRFPSPPADCSSCPILPATREHCTARPCDRVGGCNSVRGMCSFGLSVEPTPPVLFAV
jgi:hypothetical protein